MGKTQVFVILLSFCDLVHAQIIVDLFAKQLNNALNVPKITNRWAKSQKYGQFSTNARLFKRQATWEHCWYSLASGQRECVLHSPLIKSCIWNPESCSSTLILAGNNLQQPNIGLWNKRAQPCNEATRALWISACSERYWAPCEQPHVHCSHMKTGPKFVKKGTWFRVKRGPKDQKRTFGNRKRD